MSRRLGKAKRHPTNSVKCWVTLNFTQPTNYAEKGSAGVEDENEGKREKSGF